MARQPKWTSRAVPNKAPKRRAKVLSRDIDRGGQTLFLTGKILTNEGETGQRADGFGEPKKHAQTEDVVGMTR
jgi:hypothetical protein